MTHFFQRSTLVLLAGAALGALAGPQGAIAQIATKPANLADATPSMATVAPGVDAAAHARSRRHKAAPAAAPAEDAATYKVRKGDTLAKVADKLGTSVEALAKANGLKKPYRLDAGDVLKNPAAPKEEAKAASSKGKGKKGGGSAPETYTVKSGDTLFSISKRYGVSVDALKAENHLGKSSSLARGRKLTIPGTGGHAEPAEEAAPPPSHDRHGRGAPEPREEASDRGGPGRLVTIETAGKAYRVRKGDNLEKVARKLGADTDDIIRINHLKKPYRVRPGQTLRGPGGSAKAYEVARGDTLASVAERFGVTTDQLRRANGLRRGAALAPGRKLRLPAGYRDHGSSSRGGYEPVEPSYRPPAPPASRDTLPGGPQPYIPQPRRPSGSFTPGGSVSGAPVAGPSVPDSVIAERGRGLFIWPLRGAILSSFGDKGAGQRNDGLNIKANAGDPVRAAAAGEVIYSGDQVPGFGNLVLISHPDGWVTAYSNLGKVGVKMRQKVAQGEQVGEAGQSGGVPEPQLHFEVRYRANPTEKYSPVDPTLVLPK